MIQYLLTEIHYTLGQLLNYLDKSFYESEWFYAAISVTIAILSPIIGWFLVSGQNKWAIKEKQKIRIYENINEMDKKYPAKIVSPRSLILSYFNLAIVRHSPVTDPEDKMGKEFFNIQNKIRDEIFEAIQDNLIFSGYIEGWENALPVLRKPRREYHKFLVSLDWKKYGEKLFYLLYEDGFKFEDKTKQTALDLAETIEKTFIESLSYRIDLMNICQKHLLSEIFPKTESLASREPDYRVDQDLQILTEDGFRFAKDIFK